MDIDPNKQNQAIEQARKILQESEQRRAAIRLEKCFRELVDGNIEVLENDEIISNLAHFIYAMHEDGEGELTASALFNLANGVCHSDRHFRERSVMVLSIFISRSLQDGDELYFDLLSKNLVLWLKNEDVFIAGFEFVCQQLQAMVLRLLENGKWYECEGLLVVMYQIHSGILVKSNVIKQVVGKILSQLAHDDTMDALLECYLDPHDEWRDIAESILIHLGPKAISFLIEKLTKEESREKRMMLIDTIPIGIEVSRTARLYLENYPEWYIARNMILLLGREDREENFHLIKPFATHSDMRVQQQVINSIWKIGGAELEERLLGLIANINDDLKVSLVIQLGQLKGTKEIGEGFISLLERRDSFSRLIKEELISTLCQYLADFPSNKALDCLDNLIAERRKETQGEDKIINIALNTKSKIVQAIAHTPTLRKPIAVVDDDTELDDLNLDFSLEDDSAIIEETTGDLADDTGPTLEFDLQEDGTIVDERFGVNDKKGIGEADEEEEDDAFLEIMAETGNSAVTRESSEGYEEHHVSIWSDLYEGMDTAEFDLFYSLFDQVQFYPEEPIVQQNSHDQILIFFDSGDIAVQVDGGTKGISFKNFQPGDMAGSQTFYENIPWPYSLIAQERVDAHVLRKEAVERFIDEQPGLLKKLENYCQQNDFTAKLLAMLGNKSDGQSIKLSNMNKNFSVLNTDDKSSLGCGTSRGGMCLVVPVEEGATFKDFSSLLVEAVLCDNDDKCEKIFGVVVGAQEEQNGAGIRLLIRYYNPYRTSQYRCSSLTFL